jgi:hypothetical protein
MKTKFAALFLLIVLLAACAPSGAGSPTPNVLATMVAGTMQAVTPLAPPPTSMVITIPNSVTTNGVAVAYNNVTLSVPVGVATGAHGETAPRKEDPSGLAGANEPQHVVITLDSYSLGQRFHQPQVLVYPVQDYAAMDENAAAMIEQLRTILGDNSPTFPDKLPHLPIFNAEQLLHAQVKRLDFGSGKGIRYLTQYAQAFVPINNNELLYTFQGLTNDGKYYVSVQLPISSPLMDSMSQPNFNDPAFTGEQYVTYLQGVTTTLNSMASPFFSPSTDMLDQLVLSIVVQ